MIDLHTHLLPAVDDGARTLEQAQDVLRQFAAHGVRAVGCTPHLRASAIRAGRVPDLSVAFATLRDAAPSTIALVLGREVMLDEPGVVCTDQPVTLGSSRAVLVEFPHGPAPIGAARELARLCDIGFVPVLAHPERIVGATLDDVIAWRAVGAVMQVDATTLCGEGTRARLARAIVRAGAADLLASDNHGDTRALATARAWLHARGGAVAASLLTEENPARLLRDEPCVPVPAVDLPADGPRGALLAWLRARLGPRHAMLAA